MISCQQAGAYISQEQDAELGLRQRIALRLHLLMCKNCRRYQQQLTLIQHISTQYQLCDDEPDSTEPP